MRLAAEAGSASEELRASVVATLQSVTKLKGTVDLVTPGTLPNDGRVIADERKVD
jgi:phenylacetate-CoA ligase